MENFVPIDIERARRFLSGHHRGVLATRRRDGRVQRSPVTPEIDPSGRVIISSRERAYKVMNLRREPHATLCAFAAEFHGERWLRVEGPAEIVGLPHTTHGPVHLWRQAYGEPDDWREFEDRMRRERRLLIRIAIEQAGP